MDVSWILFYSRIKILLYFVIILLYRLYRYCYNYIIISISNLFIVIIDF